MKRLHIRAGLALGGALLLGACQTVGGPGGSSYYECDRGTRLKIDYVRNGALVSVDGRRALPLRTTQSVGGQNYEGAGGARLHIQGGSATWNTADRSAPQTCRQVAMPR
ncbi:MliC family protein [Sphingopyxis sp. NJF-3]